MKERYTKIINLFRKQINTINWPPCQGRTRKQEEVRSLSQYSQIIMTHIVEALVFVVVQLRVCVRALACSRFPPL